MAIYSASSETKSHLGGGKRDWRTDQTFYMEIAWLGSWSRILVGVVETLVVVVASYLVLKIARRQIRDVGERAKLPPELVSLFDSVIKFAICFVAFYLILVIWDVTSIIMPLSLVPACWLWQ